MKNDGDSEDRFVDLASRLWDAPMCASSKCTRYSSLFRLASLHVGELFSHRLGEERWYDMKDIFETEAYLQEGTASVGMPTARKT